MSQWTHVNGCIRIDGIELDDDITSPSRGDIEQILGKICGYGEMEDFEVCEKCMTPCGSEGSLRYRALKIGKGAVLWTIPIWGDLRDYQDIEEIKAWFTKIITSGVTIRNAVIEIEIEYIRHIILVSKYDSKNKNYYVETIIAKESS